MQPDIIDVQTGSGLSVREDNDNLPHDHSHYLNVMNSTLVYKPRFKTMCVELTFTIDFSSNYDTPDNILFYSMDKILAYLKQNVNDNQKVGFTFSLPSLPEVKPFGIKLSFMKELNAELIVDIFSTVNQSNSTFSSNNISLN